MKSAAGLYWKFTKNATAKTQGTMTKCFVCCRSIQRLWSTFVTKSTGIMRFYLFLKFQISFLLKFLFVYCPLKRGNWAYLTNLVIKDLTVMREDVPVMCHQIAEVYFLCHVTLTCLQLCSNTQFWTQDNVWHYLLSNISICNLLYNN